MKIRVVVFSWMLAYSGLRTTAQTRVDLKSQSKSVDFSGASSTKPLRAGSSLPATCSVGELFFLISGSAGANIYFCPTTNTWTVPGTASVFGRTGAVTAQSGDYTFPQIGGTAVKSQLPASAMFTDSPPASPGFASAATNWLGFDSTANKWHVWDSQDGTLPVLHPGDAVLIQGGMRAQPVTPPSGQAALYVNNTDKKIHSVDDSGLDTAYGPSSGGAGSTLTIANAGTTGSTLNTLTKLTGAPSTAVIAATTDTGGIVGITTAGAGTTGSATIQQSGSVNCVFDGATAAGDYVQISATSAGNCHDAGSNYPASGHVIGRVLSTNGAGGTYGISLFSPDIKAWSGSGGSGVTRIDYQAAAPAITGDATDHTVYATTISSLPAGACVNVRFGLTHSSGSVSVTYKLFYSTFAVTWAALTHTGAKVGEAQLCNNPGVQNAQQWNVLPGASNNGGSFAGTLPTVTTGGAINSASPQTLKLTFNVASTDQVTPQFWYVTESN